MDSEDGPAVLFIHGLLGSHRNWMHLVDKLDDRHRVLALDHYAAQKCCRTPRARERAIGRFE